MLEEPTSLRIDDPGVRALFTEAARFQSWLDVEAALAQAQAELGIIPDATAREITRKAQLKYLDLSCALRVISRAAASGRSEEHTSELQSQSNLVCRLLLEKK